MKKLLPFMLLFLLSYPAFGQVVSSTPSSNLVSDDAACTSPGCSPPLPTQINGANGTDYNKCLATAGTVGPVGFFYNLTLVSCGGGGGGSPGGSTNNVQYNAGGSFGGISGANRFGSAIVFDSQALRMLGASTGTAWIDYQDATVTDRIYTIPTISALTDTFATLGSTQTFTGVNTFNRNTAALPTALSGAIIRVGQADATNGRIEIDTFANNGAFTCMRENGTAAAPTTLVSGNLLCSYSSYGYDGTAISAASAAHIQMFAGGTWSNTSHPSYIQIATTPTGSTTNAAVIQFENDGGITIPPTVTGGDCGAGCLNAAAIRQAGVALGSNAFTSTAYAPLASPTFTGTPSAPSLALTGTAGAGFESFVAQSSAPSAPASGFAEYADSTGRFSWIRASDGFTRTWDATLTANRVYTLPDASDTIAVLALAQTLTNKTIAFASNTLTGVAPLASPTFTGTVTMPDSGTWTSSGIASTTALGLTSAAKLTWNSDTYIERNAAGDLRHGDVDSGTPVAQIIRMQSGSGTNINAPATTIIAALATGSGTSGSIVFKTGPTGTTGTTQATATPAVTINTPAGTLALPTVAINACGTDCGIYSAGTGKLAIGVAGLKILDYNDSVAGSWYLGVPLLSSSSINAGGNTTLGWFGRGQMSSPATNTVQIGSADTTTAAAQTLRILSVSGASNVSTGNFTLRGPLSTGSGTSGDVIIQTGGTGAGAAVQNTAVTAFTCKGVTQLCYTNSATQILGSNTTITGGGTANVPTLTTGPVTGNPTKWLPYDDNGTTRYIPAW